MSILLYRCSTELQIEADRRYERDPRGDIKHGLDLIFELKEEIDKLHPLAQETIKRLLAY